MCYYLLICYLQLKVADTCYHFQQFHNHHNYYVIMLSHNLEGIICNLVLPEPIEGQSQYHALYILQCVWLSLDVAKCKIMSLIITVLLHLYLLLIDNNHHFCCFATLLIVFCDCFRCFRTGIRHLGVVL